MSRNAFSILATIAVIVLIIGTLWGVSAMTVNESGAKHAASAMGFSQVEIEDSGFIFPVFRGCNSNDFSWYKVNAVNANGDDVNLRVCKGLFKGYTVRVK